MSTVIIPTCSGAFVLGTNREVDRDELPPQPTYPGMPQVESYRQSQVAYRSHKEVVGSLGELLKRIGPAVERQPTEWDLALSGASPFAPSPGSIPVAPGTEMIGIRRLDEGFIVDSDVSESPRTPGKVLVVRKQVGEETHFEIQAGKAFQFPQLPGVQGTGSKVYAFGSAAAVVNFLAEHLSRFAR